MKNEKDGAVIPHSLKIKKIYTLAAVVLLILLYIVIFRFSAEDAEQSSSVSIRVTKMLLRIYYRAAGGKGAAGGSEESIAAAVPLVEGFVRKLAHFIEYMCMGFLSYSIVAMWYRPLWKGWLMVLVQVFLSAGIDEFHQYFIPGRYACFRDVMIDTAGGVTGTLFLLACWIMIGNIKKYLNTLPFHDLL